MDTPDRVTIIEANKEHGDCNLWVALGEGDELAFGMCERITVRNRLKWWLFCHVFPFHIKSWEEAVPEWANDVLRDREAK